MGHHSSVNYVEPNLTAVANTNNSSSGIVSWKVSDDYERAPRLEDYCITLNLEVEVCSRENLSASEQITKDVLIMSYKTQQNGSGDTVNFMGGTKIKCGNAEDTQIPFLTTNYADMYVGDLVDYGTTEMIGIKSIDIEYQKSCVPIITIKFTDVRGLSLFQPTELSRTNSYQGIGGINSDNVAQSFFQCFFRVPMPKFTITIKGFYGKPVTYEMLCDKFDTNFNSNTGDFEVNTRFIGYGYSFLTDVSMDALLAAPYSDYGGKSGDFNKYWVEQINAGRFVLPNKEKTDNNVPMPTLYQIYENIQLLTNETIPSSTYLDEEEVHHETEIRELTEIKNKCEDWYRSLFNICVERYGKDYCFLYEKENGTNEVEYTRIVILTKEDSPTSLAWEYEQFPDAFKEMNVLLHSTITEFNKKDSSFKELKNVSDDFSDYLLNPLFNRMFINMKGEIVFNGFDKKNHLPETETVNNMFKKVSFSGATDEDIIAHKKHVLGTIYNDGATQYVKCYSIELDYSSIQTRIRALVADANRSVKDKIQEKRLKHVNKVLFSRMNWFPSVENFTKIMIAHLETMMKLMYDVVEECGDRTAEQLGVTTGPDGNCTDVNSKDKKIPPFPRVTKNIVGDDNITKVEDTWVGEFKSGTVPFTEVDFIDGFFNGIEKINALRKDLNTILQEQGRNESIKNSVETIVKYPLTTFDLFTKLPIYGSPNDISNDTMEGYHFCGKVMIRMFDIFSVSSFADHYKDKMDISTIARVEADNFYESTPITNKNFLQMIRDETVSSTEILKKVTSSNNDGRCPWGRTPLFSNNGGNLDLVRYGVSGYTNSLYPIQDISFSSMKTTHEFFSQGKFSSRQDTVAVKSLPRGIKNGLKKDNKSGFGNIVIMEDISFVNNVLESANNDVSHDYDDFYKTICQASKFEPTQVAKFFDIENSSLIKVNDDSSIDYEDELNGGEFSSNYIGKFYGFNIQNGALEYNKSIKDTYKDLEKAIPSGTTATCIDLSLNHTGIKTGSMLLSTCVNDEKYKNFIIDSSFSYLPKLCVLRIGAICFATNCGEGLKEENKIITKTYNLYKVSPNKCEVHAVYKLSRLAQYEFARYFHECITNTNNNTLGAMYSTIASSNFHYLNGGNTLNPTLKFVKDVSNVLLKPVLVTKLTSFTTNTASTITIKEGDAKTYLNGFLERLKERYHIDYSVDDNGNLIKTTDEPRKTTDDMRSELYRYMKQLYDKWVPMSSFEDWKLESFFPNKKGEEMGHTFYFIDSYYNHIGDKLLVNPLNLANTVIALMDNGDINATLLGFLADVYGQNRCMMYTLQNFSDLNKEGAMNEMFTPMSFNSIKWDEVNKYPSFVVVYPYEPSKNLNIANNEYNDDGFMLNDEFDTPKAIRSKNVDENTRHYRIPAFGVSYGKQYQSYFKNVNINMQNPVATQQSIKAKHFILQQNQHQKERGIVGQDLYDIYSTQSYTCNVEMMGCAWVQPLMYFVLLNIPMFRGSYLIMNVKHSIRPGDMTTTFTGCRMANVSNKIIEDIFTDDESLMNGVLDDSFETDKQLKADIDNDCPYKVYPLWGSDDVELSGDEFKDAKKAMDILIRTHGFSDVAAAGICGNIFQESKWVLYNTNTSSGAFGLCQWLGSRKSKLIGTYGERPNFSQQLAFCASEWKAPGGPDVSVNGVNGYTLLTGATTPTSAAKIVRRYFEKCGDAEANDEVRCSRAEKYYSAYNSTSINYSNSSKPKEDMKTDVSQALFDSVNKSARFTPSIGVALKLEKPLGKNDYYAITQENHANDKLHKVFDMILNTNEYFSYIQELVWVAKENTLQSDIPPVAIYYKASESVKNESVHVSVVQEGHVVSEWRKKYDISEGNTYLLKSLAKKASTMREDTFKKTVEQLKDVALLEKYKPQECETLFVTRSGGSSSVEWRNAVEKMGKWYEKNIHSYSQTSFTPCPLLNGVKVRHDCSGYVSACLQYYGVIKNNAIYNSTMYTNDSGVSDLLTSSKFSKLTYSWDDVKPYDIISYSGHVEILAEKGDKPKSWGWGSCHDGFGKNPTMPAPTGNKPKGKTYKVIWRYMG